MFFLKTISFVFILLISFHNAYAEYVVAYDKIISEIENAIRFSEDISQEEQDNYLDTINISSLLEDILPGGIDFKTEQLAHSILKRPVEIWTTDIEIIPSIIKRSAMEIVLYAKQVNDTPSVDPATKNNMIKDINKLADSIEKFLISEFSGVVSESLITRQIDSLQQRLIQQIDDPMTYRMKEPLSDEAVKHYLTVFKERFEMTKHRAIKRLENARKSDEENKSDKGYNIVCIQILDEIMRPVTKAVYKETSIQDLAKVNPDAIVPGYMDVVQITENKRQEIFQKKHEEVIRELEEKQQVHSILADVNLNNAIEEALIDLDIDKTIFEKSNNKKIYLSANNDPKVHIESNSVIAPSNKTQITTTIEKKKHTLASKSVTGKIALGGIGCAILIAFLLIYTKSIKKT